MIRFNSKTLNGEVAIGFKHTLPYIEVGPQNNRLDSVNVVRVPGNTKCLLILPSGVGDVTSEYIGYAYTHPADQYKKEVGREYSLKRAIEAANLTEAQAREVMAAYYSR